MPASENRLRRSKALGRGAELINWPLVELLLLRPEMLRGAADPPEPAWEMDQLDSRRRSSTLALYRDPGLDHTILRASRLCCEGRRPRDTGVPCANMGYSTPQCRSTHLPPPPPIIHASPKSGGEEIKRKVAGFLISSSLWSHRSTGDQARSSSSMEGEHLQETSAIPPWLRRAADR